MPHRPIVKNITRFRLVGKSGFAYILMEDCSNGLTLRQISDMLDGRIICREDRADEEVLSACGCDLMSDVLAFTRAGSVLLTGLTNSQVVRTAEMLDLTGIVFVRDKRPDEHTVRMAEALGLVIILSPHPLYESCGRLYKAGLTGCREQQVVG